jgi:hypothetical protein
VFPINAGSIGMGDLRRMMRASTSHSGICALFQGQRRFLNHAFRAVNHSAFDQNQMSYDFSARRFFRIDLFNAPAR